MLSATSSSALFTYVFLTTLRVSVLYWTLGAALGILLHVVFFPDSVRHVFGGTSGPATSTLASRPDSEHPWTSFANMPSSAPAAVEEASAP
jgi:hypothetical protein